MQGLLLMLFGVRGWSLQLSRGQCLLWGQRFRRGSLKLQVRRGDLLDASGELLCLNRVSLVLDRLWHFFRQLGDMKWVLHELQCRSPFDLSQLGIRGNLERLHRGSPRIRGMGRLILRWGLHETCLIEELILRNGLSLITLSLESMRRRTLDLRRGIMNNSWSLDLLLLNRGR